MSVFDTADTASTQTVFEASVSRMLPVLVGFSVLMLRVGWADTVSTDVVCFWGYFWFPYSRYCQH